MPRKENEKKNLIGEEDVAKSPSCQEHSERKKVTSHDDVL